jgi:hypothetical protein
MTTQPIRASHVSKVIIGAVGVSLAVFTAEFVKTLFGIFGDISTAADFFGSADVMMYLTIEGMFLIGIIAGAYFVLTKR